MSQLLSHMRILNALPGPGSSFDRTFEDAGRIPITRLLIEAEQTLFENGFSREANDLVRIQEQLEHVYISIRSTALSAHLNISTWKNQTIKLLMIDIMRFSQESYQRYSDRETAMVESKVRQLISDGFEVIPFTECRVVPDPPPNDGYDTRLGKPGATEASLS